MRAAQDYPEDFDGVIAGSPGINEAHLLGAHGIWNLAGQKLNDTDWDLVRSEVLRQCDGLDGLHDGIIDDPDACAFEPEVLLCEGEKRPDCLTVNQVEALRRIYSPIYGHDGELLCSREDPGMEGDLDIAPGFFAGPFYILPLVSYERLLH